LSYAGTPGVHNRVIDFLSGLIVGGTHDGRKVE
jgi:hypothetical protein